MGEIKLHREQGELLLAMARNAIEAALEVDHPKEFEFPWLEEKGATFVTLFVKGQLHGCIGSIEATRSWRIDVLQNAQNAAFKDPRFPALRKSDLKDLRVEVSCLSPRVEIFPCSREELESVLRPGQDGVVIEDGFQRATFLPQVWDSLTDQKSFLDHLFQKAGLTSSHWSDSLRVWTYQAQKWEEE